MDKLIENFVLGCFKNILDYKAPRNILVFELVWHKNINIYVIVQRYCEILNSIKFIINNIKINFQLAMTNKKIGQFFVHLII